MNARNGITYVLALIALVALAAGACSTEVGPGPDGPTTVATPEVTSPLDSQTEEALDSVGDSPLDPASRSGEEGADTIIDEAAVERVTVDVVASLPSQLSVTIRGYLRDGCTEIASIEQVEQRDNVIVIRVTTERPADALCTQAVVPFEETVPVDITDLQPGTYTLSVNGTTATFDLGADGVSLPPESGESGTIGETLVDEAPVSTAEVVPDDASPSGYSVRVTGNMRDGCTKISRVEQVKQGEKIVVRLFTSRPADQMCTTVIVPYEELIPLDASNLSAGEYTLDVNGITSDFTLEEGQLGGGGSVPAADGCPEATSGMESFADRVQGYCLLYPTGTRLEQPQAGLTTIVGPAVGEEQIRPSVNIHVENAPFSTLESVVAEWEQEYPDVELQISETTVGGEAAVAVENLPGRTGNRQVFVISAGNLYKLVVQPVDPAFPEASAAAEQLWSEVLESFRFVEPQSAG
jgi:hypothetical protein